MLFLAVLALWATACKKEAPTVPAQQTQPTQDGQDGNGGEDTETGEGGDTTPDDGQDSSVDPGDEPQPPAPPVPTLETFRFSRADNPGLSEDIVLDVSTDTIDFFLPGLHTDALVASFAVGEGVSSVTVADVPQVSGETVNDFNDAVAYRLTGADGREATYVLRIRGYNGLPRLEVDTEGGVDVTDKETWRTAQIKLGNNPLTGAGTYAGKIKGRGNATWRDYPKKPYKIKLDKKKGLFGFEEDKDWILLADYCDYALLRTAYMCEVSRAVGMDWTVSYQHVELWLNGKYKGVYVLTSQVERGEGRVDCADDGFLFENDNYYNEEPLYINTSVMGYKYTLKYPDPDDGEITVGDQSYYFLKNFLEAMERKLKAIPGDCSSYRQYINTTSFAKWFVANEVLGNWEPNLYYVLPSRTEQVKMTPMWDAEWSLGLAERNSSDTGWKYHDSGAVPQHNVSMWNWRRYFPYLLKDPAFVDEVKAEWARFKERIPAVKEALAARRAALEYAAPANFDRWPVMGNYIRDVTLVYFNTWEEAVDYVEDFFDKRITYMDSVYGE